MTAAARLPLGDPRKRVPTRPSAIHATGGQAHLDAFDDLAAACARLVSLSGLAARPAGFTLKLADEVATCAFSGLDLFPGWSVYLRDRGGVSQWVGTLCAQDRPRAEVAAALAEAVAATGRRAAA